MSFEIDKYAELARKLKCSVCHRWLVFPIYFNLDQKLVCGRHTCQDAYSRAKFFESFVKTFKFPCVHQEHGCKELFNANELHNHELDCTYESLNCPRCQCWKGTLKGLNRHIKDEHTVLYPAIINLPIKICCRPLKTHFTRKNSRLFTIDINYVAEGIQVRVMLNGREPDNELFDYGLKISHEFVKGTLSRSFDKTEAFNNSDNAAKGNEIKFSEIQSALQIKSGIVKMTIEIFAKQKSTDLQCSACLQEMTPPIVTCGTVSLLLLGIMRSKA